MINAFGTTKLSGERPDYHRRIEWHAHASVPQMHARARSYLSDVSHSKNTHIFIWCETYARNFIHAKTMMYISLSLSLLPLSSFLHIPLSYSHTHTYTHILSLSLSSLFSLIYRKIELALLLAQIL